MGKQFSVLQAVSSRVTQGLLLVLVELLEYNVVGLICWFFSLISDAARLKFS